MNDASARDIEKLTNREDILEASRVVADALQVEPGFFTVVPDSEQRRVVMQTLMSRLVRDAFPFGNVWVARAESGIVGTAIWYAPGDYPMSMWRNLRMAPAMLSLLSVVGPRTVQALGQMDQNLRSHFPDRPCWYLAAFGVDPALQGKGVGSRMMHAALREIDAQRKPAYLETGEERNVRFYDRLGFQVRDPDIHIAPPPGPTHWTMWREPGELADTDQSPPTGTGLKFVSLS